ncbi:glycosyltransferase family 2 protein [Nostoc sp. CENA67]|uniref:Glycosyltransferase family 2 protein n=1 Tax=Amazonocrinis nigriterrae CENA67 TaxID=2794033 RepID=A0A8J7HXZ1_9NOST|nr:glycosyltransferase [Amazonocrinis nigriterrae]MBH8565427.1 glycosyltransferase family 2 protein [Amazonocrinis nigriterrae CENA67]
MKQPKITIVVSPREQFSLSSQSLESIYQYTDLPFSLIYVDGASPPQVQKYLETKAQEKGFKIIRTEQYLSPNQARNLAIPHVQTEYLVFIDNDVIVSPNWLDHLLECAQQTRATIVCPLTCIGKPIHEIIHLAGGEARILSEETKTGIKRKVHEKHYFVNRPVADVHEQLHRQQCEFAEFHCMLVRTSIFDQIGLLDEGLLNTREHIDFCMSVTNAGGTVYCEPKSVVTYVPELPFNWADISFFLLRWSDEWELASLEHFSQKWNLTKQDKYFKKRYKRLGHRRHHAFLKPLLRRLPFGDSPWLEQQAIAMERRFNRLLTSRYAKAHAQGKISPQIKDFTRLPLVSERELAQQSKK